MTLKEYLEDYASPQTRELGKMCIRDSQEGVQLGKLLAKKVLAHETDGALKELSDMLNI